MTGALPKTTYIQRFERIANRFSPRVAVSLKTPEGYLEITYGELERQVKGIARTLVRQGLQKGERVAILSENRPEWVIAYLGIYFAGGTAVPLDPQISPGEWLRLLDDSESRWIFASGQLAQKIHRAFPDSPVLARVVSFDPDGAFGSFHDWASSDNNGSTAPALPTVDSQDVAVIIYTSGTTGNPKGVMLTQENIVSDINGALEAIHGINENDAFLCLLPLQHVFASVVSFLVPLYVGGKTVFADTLKRSEILAALKEAGISVLATVPQFFYLFHTRIEEELAHRGAFARKLFRVLLKLNRYSIQLLRINFGKMLFGKIHANFGSSLRLFVSGGSAFDAKVAQLFFDLGFIILQGYGLTETTGACAVTRIERNAIGSVGPALPEVGIKIVQPDATGIGEVAIRGPIVMKGYYRNPEATSQVFCDGWFMSGDLGRLDPHGNLFITGRKKEVIVLPNGKNIYPDEIEAHYSQCPLIKEIAVLGIAEPGHQGAERLHAVVVPDFDVLKAKRIANAREALRDEIARFSNQLPKYKRLMSYQIQKETLPRTTTRKIKRLELKRMIEGGELREQIGAATIAISAEDRDLLDSPVGQEVAAILRESYHRDLPLAPEMNLELDLGFDSMERVELLAGLEQALNIRLAENFGIEIFTIRDLIRGLQEQAATTGSGSEPQKQSWRQILSAESLSKDPDLEPRFAGATVDWFRYLGIKILKGFFRIFFRFEAVGIEHLPRQGPFIICPNHVSYLDALIVLAPLPYRILKQVFFVGAADFFASAWMKALSRIANIFPVDPDAHLLRAMKVGAFGLRAGRILCIFPEGARSFDGKPGVFKKGAAILAREMEVPIIPAAILGAYEAWPRDGKRIRLHKIKIVFGAPLRFNEAEAGPPYQQDTARIRSRIESMMDANPL
jgi:long-chain acyl-CoA synthetase